MLFHFTPREPRGYGGLFFKPHNYSSYGSSIYGGMIGGTEVEEEVEKEEPKHPDDGEIKIIHGEKNKVDIDE